jgi:2-oxo-3-hexenedioate decarboxylase
VARIEQRIFQAKDLLEKAAAERRAIAPLSQRWPDLSISEAYAIQSELIRQRLARGERLLGMKLGLTSRAKQEQVGVSTPIIGWLTDAMHVPMGAPLPRERLIHPRVEPEIVFLMGKRVSGATVTAQDVLHAVSAVSAGLEVLDSRYTDFRFTLPDVIADNASAAYFLLGGIEVPPSGCDLRQEECSLKVNGRIVSRARGEAVMGHPAEAVAHAARLLAEQGMAIESGWIVLTGGLTEAVPLATGDIVEAHFTHLGTVSLVCP